LVTGGGNLNEALKYANLAVEEGIKQNLDEALVKNFKNTLNLAETALAESGKTKAGKRERD
ncbi:MAG: hypothetical protein LBF41_09245, partial [Deltaproteobacteria bacterium]|nr:hypothetical protein [Deltaproteobacteria bacterium]